MIKIGEGARWNGNSDKSMSNIGEGALAGAVAPELDCEVAVAVAVAVTCSQ